jgi:glycosyltransferase involved in cell wall biosynthesis
VSGATAPLFSIVTPVYNTPLDILRTTIASVLAQTFDDWELILVDDHSPEQAVRDVLREAAAADTRIRVIERESNGHIVVASNDGVDAARGEFIALLDHDDLLVPEALERVKQVIDRAPKADYIYSDEDKVDDTGAHFDRFYKPQWSPERLRGHMYTCHFSVLRTSCVREVGGFHEGTEGSQDHDLALRVTEVARRIVHIPEVLYHWRVIPGSAAGDQEAKPYAWHAGRRVVQAHLDRVGIDGTVELGPTRGTYRIHRRLDPAVRVSVVIPTRGADALIWGERRVFVVEAVRSLLQRSGHDNLEVVVVHDAQTPAKVLAALRAVAPEVLQLVPYDRPFNFSEKCNVGVLHSHGDVVVLMNDDMEVIDDGFVTQLVAPLLEDGVGMTGANLTLTDGTVQHAGVVLDDRLALMFGGQERQVAHVGPLLVRNSQRSQVGSAMVVNRETSALTGACLAMTRRLYDEVGGMCETFGLNFGDVDLSLKVAEAGYRRIWVAAARAYHFEGQTRRNPSVKSGEVRRLFRRWTLPHYDPYLPGDLLHAVQTGRVRSPGGLRRRVRFQ